MSIFLLDTNIASDIIKGQQSTVLKRLVAVPIESVAISVVTQAELIFGVAKRLHPAGLSARVEAFLARVEVLSWSPDTARCYGELRAACEARGVTLATMDMLIAAHAQSIGAVLVTRDQIFKRIPNGPTLEDWSKARG